MRKEIIELMHRASLKKNTILNAIKTLSSILFPLITFPYINRVLLPDNVGKINFGLSVVSYFSLIASLGIATYAIRECACVRDDNEKLSDTASQIFSINVITTIFAYISLAITILVVPSFEEYRTLIVIQSMSIVLTTIGADWLNSAMEDFKYITIRTVIFQIISLVLMFIFVRQPEDYMKYAVISVISCGGSNILNVWYRKRYCKVRFIFNVWKKIEWKKHFVPILYFFVMILSQTIFNSVDTTMLGLMHGDREVGIYSVANKMFNIIVQLVASILMVIMPRMSYYFEKKDYVQINTLLRKVLGFNLLIGLPIVVGGIITAEDIIRVVAGDEYLESTIVFQILLIGFAFSLVGGNFLGNAILLPSKNEKYYMVVCCITAVVNVIGNYILIPNFGPVGAACMTSVCSLIIMLLLIFKVDKHIKILNIGRLIVSPLVGVFVIAIICIVCKMIPDLWIRFFVSIIGSAIAYAILLVLMKNEMVCEMMNSIKKKLKCF